MQNPIKENVSVSKIVGFVVVAIVTFAILDVAGFTDYLLYPYTSIKAKFFPGK